MWTKEPTTLEGLSGTILRKESLWHENRTAGTPTWDPPVLVRSSLAIVIYPIDVFVRTLLPCRPSTKEACARINEPFSPICCACLAVEFSTPLEYYAFAPQNSTEFRCPLRNSVSALCLNTLFGRSSVMALWSFSYLRTEMALKRLLQSTRDFIHDFPLSRKGLLSVVAQPSTGGDDSTDHLALESSHCQLTGSGNLLS